MSTSVGFALEPIELSTIAFGRSPRTSFAAEHWIAHRWRHRWTVVDETLGRHGCSHTLVEYSRDFHHPLALGDTRLDPIAHLHRRRRLRWSSVDDDMTGATEFVGGGSRGGEAHRPQPSVDSCRVDVCRVDVCRVDDFIVPPQEVTAQPGWSAGEIAEADSALGEDGDHRRL